MCFNILVSRFISVVDSLADLAVNSLSVVKKKKEKEKHKKNRKIQVTT